MKMPKVVSRVIFWHFSNNIKVAGNAYMASCIMFLAPSREHLPGPLWGSLALCGALSATLWGSLLGFSGALVGSLEFSGVSEAPGNSRAAPSSARQLQAATGSSRIPGSSKELQAIPGSSNQFQTLQAALGQMARLAWLVELAGLALTSVPVCLT